MHTYYTIPIISTLYCIVSYHINFSSCVQQLVISSKSVGWKKQGTCILVDNEPPPPTIEGFESEKGWKHVKGLVVNQGGGDFLFPADQLLVVTKKGYKAIADDGKRTLSKLSAQQGYLVWYHHVMSTAVWAKNKKKMG
jgi:hypothetical protein